MQKKKKKNFCLERRVRAVTIFFKDISHVFCLFACFFAFIFFFFYILAIHFQSHEFIKESLLNKT